MAEQVPEQKEVPTREVNGEADDKEEPEPVGEATKKKRKKKKKSNKSVATGKTAERVLMLTANRQKAADKRSGNDHTGLSN